jgi:cell surface protein SprA
MPVNLQDIGLDGLNDADERVKFAAIVATDKAQLKRAGGNAAYAADPSTDDYQYYQGPRLIRPMGILGAYSKYNGTDGNSKTSAQSQAELGLAKLGLNIVCPMVRTLTGIIT